MTSTSTDQPHAEVIAFRDAQWQTRWIFVGLAFLLLWRSTAFLDHDWLTRWPDWLLLVLTVLAPEAFLVLFPILTRSSRDRTKLGLPTLKRCLIEFAIAIPVVIVSLIVLATVGYLLSRLSPGTSLTPDSVERLATSSKPTFAYLFLVFSFTLGPLAEEVFFRGFLHNAFRARMPLAVAVVAQCLIFGLAHFYGLLHAVIVMFDGVLLTLVYQWRKTLISPVLVHAGLNLVMAMGIAFMIAAHANSAVLGVVGDVRDSACVVRKVAPNSPAALAELREGDVITSVNGKEISDFNRLLETIRQFHPGDTVTIAIERDGMTMETKAVLQARGKLSDR